MIRLLELRNEKGLSQREMSKIFNVSQGTYNNWENSKTQPSIEQLIAIADFFDVSVDYLIGRAEDYSKSLPSEKDLARNELLRTFDKMLPEDRAAFMWFLSKLEK